MIKLGEQLPPFVVAMVPVLNGKLVSDVNQPMYLVKPEDAEAFKIKWDGVPTGMEYIVVENVMDLRGKFPRPLP